MSTPAKFDALDGFEPVLLRPEWALPAGVYAAVSTRVLRKNSEVLPSHGSGGMDHFNLATHVGDAPEHVQARRALLQQTLNLPAAVPWLNQVHGVDVFCHATRDEFPVTPPTADACVAIGRDAAVCAVLTADCLPVLLCTQSGRAIAAVHAGWRGLLAGVIEAAISKMGTSEPISAYIGPAIGAQAFEVGAEVHAAFLAENSANASYFIPVAGGKFLADLAALARVRLKRAGVDEVLLSARCTVAESSIFYSHRAGQGSVGRFASLIWRNSAAT